MPPLFHAAKKCSAYTLHLLGLLLCSGVLLTPSTGALAATITVNSTADTAADDGVCTLREAILAADTDTASGAMPGECAAGSGTDTIDMTGISGTITVSGGALENIDTSMSLIGPGARTLTISGPNANLTLLAGALLFTLQDLTLSGSTQRGVNCTTPGGTMTLTNVTIDGHAGGGVRLISSCALVMTGSTVSNNTALSDFDVGAGLNVDSPTAMATVTNSTISGNMTAFEDGFASNGGGGIKNRGTLTLNNVTVANNSFFTSDGGFGTSGGGGIATQSGATTTLINTIVADNTVTGDSSGPDCLTTGGDTIVVSSGDNLIENQSSCTLTGTATSGDPALTALADNGGPTDTHLPAALVINTGNCNEATDQRGFPRPEPSGTLCDIGALEVGSSLPVELSRLRARFDGDDVVLRWQTLSETNNAGFEVQRLFEQDGQAYPNILGFVEGAGTTTKARHYQFRVTDPDVGQYRFRLKQVDFDGAFAFSPEVEVTVKVPAGHVLSAAYPNPFNRSTNFSIAVARQQQVKVTVHDVTGRLVQTLFDGTVAAHQPQWIEIDAAGWSSGVYLYRVSGAHFAESRGVFLQK